jgi:hypothetical protein
LSNTSMRLLPLATCATPRPRDKANAAPASALLFRNSLRCISQPSLPFTHP